MKNDFEHIDDLFFDALSDFEVKPSPQIKENVKKQLLVHNFFAQYGKFLTLVVLIATLSSILILFNTNKKRYFTPRSSQNIKYINSNNISLKINKSINYSESFNTGKQTHIAKTNNKHNTNNKNTAKINVNKTKNLTKNVSNKYRNKKIINNTNISRNITPSSTTKNANFETENKNTVDKNSNNLLPIQTVIVNESNESSVKKEDYKPLTIKTLNTTTLNNSVNAFSIKKQNLIIPDDTIAFDVNNEAIIASSNYWLAYLYLNPSISQSSFIANTSENKQDIDAINNNNFGLSYGFEAGINYCFKNISIGAGIAYTNFNTPVSRNEQSLKISSREYYSYQEQEIWQIDTSYYWNIDSLMQGDSVLTIITDSTMYTVTDSTLQYTNDTSFVKKSSLQTNKYRYLEFPVSVEYKFNRIGKLTPTVRLSFITGLLVKTQTAEYISNNGTILFDNNTPYIKPNFWVAVSAGLQYKVNDKISFVFTPFYRYNLKSIVDKNYLFKQKINAGGFTIGMKYKF